MQRSSGFPSKQPAPRLGGERKQCQLRPIGRIMALLIFLYLLIHHASAQKDQSEAHPGFQLDRDRRSTWDIIWSCLSTILACTWRAMHMDVPPRNASDTRLAILRARSWIVILLMPEMVIMSAASSFFRARILRQKWNQAEDHRAHDEKDLKLIFSPRKWTLCQCFCATMGGLAIQTADVWTYTINGWEVEKFIRAGLIRCSDFRDRDVEDRSKMESFSKGFTILQTTWFLCNVLTRWGYGLPVTPIEITTIAYISCGIIIYAFYWHKPKDMGFPITIFSRYSREDLPEEIRCDIASDSPQWIHTHEEVEEDKAEHLFWHKPLVTIVRDLPKFTKYAISSKPVGPDPGIILFVGEIGLFAGVTFSGLHITAWNFKFPTHGEWLAWFIMTFSSLALVFIYAIPGLIRDYLWALHERGRLSSSWEPYIRLDTSFWKKFTTAQSVIMTFYFLARLGLLALMFSSLRALPDGSYESISWMTSIPHF